MEANENYLIAFQESYKKKFGKEYSPFQLVDAWRELVESCMNGYSYSLFDFKNDIYIRELIQFGLDNKDFALYKEHSNFLKKVHEIDSDFFKIAIKNDNLDNKWWEDVLLQYGGKKYIEDVKRYHGISIPLKE